MTIASPMTSGPRILAIVVLYKIRPSESHTLSSLLSAAEADTALASRLSVMLYDNSPEKQEAWAAGGPLAITYMHDPRNLGLATAYNTALAYAQEHNFEWLLAFDQDTSASSDYFREILAVTKEMQCCPAVSAIVPKLLIRGDIYSPEKGFIYQVRHQYRRRSTFAVERDFFGIRNDRMAAYNSGAAFRVSALASISGFPSRFWLDYLDHAVFHALAARGFSMYVMRAELAHEASQATLERVPSWRQRNILAAQTMFVLEAGNKTDRFLYRIWILRYARALWRHHPDRQLWKEAVIQAMRFRTRPFHPSGSLLDTTA